MNKYQSLLTIAMSCAFILTPAVAAGPDAAASCAACHGANGISVSDTIPNLAGQKSAYLAKQLQNFRSGDRANPLMSAMAGQLSDQQITELADYFSALPVEAETDNAEMAAILDSTHLEFPTDYDAQFQQYATANRADNKQVRYLYGNKVAVDGAKDSDTLPNGSELVMEVYKAKLDADGNPIEGDDGVYVSDTLVGYAYMGKDAGLGDKIPDLLKNGDWNYAFFKADKSNGGNSQASCLACHQPKEAGDYMFRADDLRAFAAGQ